MQTRPTVTSASNPAVKAARKLARAGGHRPGEGFLVEGPQAVRESVGCLHRLLVTSASAVRHADLVDAARAGGAEVTVVDDGLLSAVAGTVTPQGLVGIADLPGAGLDAVSSASLVVVLWEVRDPGNAGAIIRTADAAGADAVVLTGDSVDPRNGKAVRASAGSLFHLPVVIERSWPDVVAACRAAGLRLVAADAGAAVAHTALDLALPTALVFGNEAKGLDGKVAADCDAAVRVPILGRAESLNLAATVAVLAYEAARQRAERRSGGRS